MSQNKQKLQIKGHSYKVQLNYLSFNFESSEEMGIYKCLGSCCSPFPQRYVVATAVLGNMIIMFLQRTCFNLALTEMAFRINVTEEYESQVCNISGSKHEKLTETNRNLAEFHWSMVDQAWLLSIFYIGYIISHLPGGIIADKKGPKTILGFGVLLSGICTILTPLCARINYFALLLLRLIMGIVQGPLFPCTSTFTARWALPIERDLMTSYINLGSIIGPMVGQLGTGYLIKNLHSWDVVYYIYGAISIPFCLLWLLFAYNRYEKHPFIKEQERTRLDSALANVLVDNVQVRYKQILISVPVWAMVIAGFGHDWAFYIILTMLPHYMSYVLLFEVNENGALLCLPYLCMFVVQMIAPYLARYVVTKGIMSKAMQYKVFFIVCNQGAVVCFLAATYTGCNRAVVVALFSVGMGTLGLCYSCVRVVQIDLAPNVSGFLMAIMNGIGALGGFIQPRVFNFFIKTNTVEGWRNGFIFSAVLITLTTVVFCIWGKAEVQAWNFPVGNQDQAEAGIEEQDEEIPENVNQADIFVMHYHS